MGAPVHDRAVSDYIRRVRAVPRLGREEERVLAEKARDGDTAAAHGLVEANLRYVVATALRYRRYGIPIGELIAEGSVGLMHALRKFEPEQGNRFCTYAGYWIRAYVLDLVVRSGRMVGAGSGALRSRTFFRLRRERSRIAALEPDPGRRLALLAERFGVDEARIATMLRQLDAHDVSLDAPMRDGTGITMLDQLGSGGEDQEHMLGRAQVERRLKAQIADALQTLDCRERFIVEHRALAEDELSLAELGRRLGVSRERARQLEARAKRKLRDHLVQSAA
jgi:RNA polymerase sigma-32 factor